MREQGIAGISPATWHPVTTIGDGSPHTIPDLVNRDFDGAGSMRCGPSTSAIWPPGVLALPVRGDGCSRRVLGWEIEDHSRTDLVETALRRAVTLRGRDTSGVIVQADWGCRYTSTRLHDVARGLRVRLSIGRTGVCWDNAQIQSFWSTLKTEYYHGHTFTTKAAGKVRVGAWIETTYNRTRRHSSLGMISPVAFEEQLMTPAAEAA
jgi:putative transposase